MAVAVNPRLPTDGVPDSDGSLTTIVKSHTEVTIPAIAAATTGTLAIATATIHPNAFALVSYGSTLAGSASSSTISYTNVKDAQYDNMVANFTAYRCVGIRYRVFQTGVLSGLNGRWYLMRWPKGYVTSSDVTGCEPANLDAIANQPYVKPGTSNDPDMEGVTDFWVPTRVGDNPGSITAGGSFAWNTATSYYGVNEGMTFMWVGVAVAGAVSSDPLLKLEVDCAWEVMIKPTALGLYGPGKVDNGSDELLAMALQELAAIQSQQSIYFDDVGPLIRRSYKRATRYLGMNPTSPSDVVGAHCELACLLQAAHRLTPSRLKLVSVGVEDLSLLQQLCTWLSGCPRGSQTTFHPVDIFTGNTIEQPEDDHESLVSVAPSVAPRHR